MKKFTFVLTVISLLIFLFTLFLFFVYYKTGKKLQTFESKEISMTYPITWNAEILDSKNGSSDLTNIVFLSKPNLSNSPSRPDEPTKNMALIEIYFKTTDKSLSDIVQNIEDEFGTILDEDYVILDNKKMGDYKAVYATLNEEYPSYVIFNDNSNRAFEISINFFDSKEDEQYSKQTIKEINNILQSIEVKN